VVHRQLHLQLRDGSIWEGRSPREPEVHGGGAFGLTLRSMLTSCSLQILTIGHTRTGSCICTAKLQQSVVVDPECPVSGHSHEVGAVSFCPDGKRIVSRSKDHRVKIFDAKTGAEVRGLMRLR